MTLLRRISTTFLLLVIVVTTRAIADWPCRSDISVPVTTDGGNQWNVRLTGDGVGGAILVWQDRRNGSTDKLFVQHMNPAGNPLWQVGGIPVSLTSGFQYYPQILADGQGGAFIVWEDNRNGVDYDIYAQRISSTGSIQWASDGIIISNASGHQYFPQIVGDGQGGIVITWQDRRNGQYDVYAQRLNANGTALWSQNGQAVCIASADQVDPHLERDGNGGAIFTWVDYRSGTPDIYAQRILSGGQIGWPANGNVICSAPNNQWNVQITSDASGGAIVTWQDRRSGSSDKVYAQRINASGATLWTGDGVQLAVSGGFQYYPRMVGDDAGGAIVAWQDNRSGSDYDIYAQRVNAAGQVLWTSNALAVSSASGHQYNPQIIKNGSSVTLVWQDKRNGTDFDIYTQRLALDGSAQWFVNGVSACISTQDQFNPQLASDQMQGAVIAWSDYRAGNGSIDIFGQRIGANGKCAGGCFRSFTQDSLALKAPRRLDHRPMPFPNTGTVRDSIFYRGVFPNGVVVGMERQDSARQYGWQYFAKSSYVRRVFPQKGTPRPFDRRHTTRWFYGVMKNPTPRLYDNSLAAEQLVLKLNIAASDVGLTEGQFGDLLFRDTSRVANPLSNKSLRQVVSSVDSMLTFWGRYKGKVDYAAINATLKKINNAFTGPVDTLCANPLKISSVRPLFSVPFLFPNIDPPAVVPLYRTQPTVGIDVPEQFQISQNYPNPFNPYTTIEFNLPDQAIVTLKVFNILGQEIATLIDHSSLEEGPQSIDFDATNVSSGVYFYQVIADPIEGGQRIISNVKKMILMK